MSEWNDELEFNKKAPTDADLYVIEKELSHIDLNKDFKEKTKTQLTKKEIDEKVKKLTKKELKMIDEMVKIIEDPSYCSSVRKKRLSKQEKDYGISFDNLGFNDDASYYGDDFDPSY